MYNGYVDMINNNKEGGKMTNFNYKPALINKDVSKAGHISLMEKHTLENLLKREFDNETSTTRRHVLSDLYEKVSKSLAINFEYEDIYEEKS